MKRKILSQSKIFTGMLPQKGLNFDTQTVTYEVMKQHLDGKFADQYYTNLPISKYCEYLMYYLTGEWYFQKMTKEKAYVGGRYGGSIAMKKQYGYVQIPTYSLPLRDHTNINLAECPDQVMVLALNVQDASAEIAFEYEDHKRKNRCISQQITCDSYWFFPADVKFQITRNNSDHINHYIICTYDEIYD